MVRRRIRDVPGIVVDQCHDTGDIGVSSYRAGLQRSMQAIGERERFRRRHVWRRVDEALPAGIVECEAVIAGAVCIRVHGRGAAIRIKFDRLL